MLGRISRPTIAMLLLGLASGASGYEADFHYGITYWLARHAGFQQKDSHELARWNQLADSGYRDAIVMMSVGTCVLDIPAASHFVRERHFRSEAPVPAPAASRPVKSIDRFASDEVRTLLKQETWTRSEQIQDFGLALHGWQDAFSHDDVSSGLLGCSDDYFWAHSEKRGGIVKRETRHDADLTYKDQTACRDAMETSYEYLLQFAQKHRAKSSSPAPAWSALVADAFQFCGLSTKTDKSDWFKKREVPQWDAIAKLTNLVDGGRSFANAGNLVLGESNSEGMIPEAEAPWYISKFGDRILRQAVDTVVDEVLKAMAPRDIPKEVKAFFARLFRDFLSSPPQEISQVRDRYFSGDVVGFPFGTLLNESLLRSRLIDRGRARESGPLSLTALNTPDLFVSANQNNWAERFVRIYKLNEPFAIVEVLNAPRKTYTAWATLAHAPYEILHVTVEYINKDVLKVTTWETRAAH